MGAVLFWDAIIVFEQLNYTKPDSIHAIFMPVIIKFSRYIALIQVRSLSQLFLLYCEAAAIKEMYNKSASNKSLHLHSTQNI